MKLKALILEDLLGHAKRELELAGMFDKDSDYGGMLGDNVLELIKVFANQGHSGFSAGIARELASKLMNYETLSPNDHSLHHDVSDMMGKPCLQDLRDSKWFSDDGGKTWYNVDEPVAESYAKKLQALQNRRDPDKIEQQKIVDGFHNNLKKKLGQD